MEKIQNKNNLKLIYILLCIALISPSIIHIITGKEIQDLVSSFSFFFTKATTDFTFAKVVGTILFIGLFIAIGVVYYKILKNHDKIFKNNKEIAKFIIIIACLFFIMLPITSTDVFYYIGTGWSEAHYGVNPYYTSVDELMLENTEAANDEMLLKMKGAWSSQTIVYGPIWPFICKILSGISMGNLSAALYIYKLFNLVLHLINTYIIYKITKKKKVFALMYGLNPLALFDGIANVHNEILVIFFILLALYFFVRKKNMALTVIFFALATAVKYFAILLIPFIVLYYYKKEKPSKKIVYSFLWAILFIVVLVACYLFYMRDFEVLKGITTQQGKFANSIFILLVIKDIRLASTVSKGFMLAYIFIYIFTILKLVFTKEEYSFSTIIRKYNSMLLLFIFGTITQFQTWYILWVLPTIMWQKSKNIKWLLSITIMAEICNVVYFLFYEHYIFGKIYCLLMFGLMILSDILCRKKKKEINFNGKNFIN